MNQMVSRFLTCASDTKNYPDNFAFIGVYLLLELCDLVVVHLNPDFLYEHSPVAKVFS